MCSDKSLTRCLFDGDDVVDVGEMLKTVARGGSGSVAMRWLVSGGLSESLVLCWGNELVPSLESEESLSMIRRC